MTILGFINRIRPWAESPTVNHSGICGTIYLRGRIGGAVETIARMNGPVTVAERIQGSIKVGC